MSFETKREVQEVCFNVANAFLEMDEKINGVQDWREKTIKRTTLERECSEVHEFTTKVAKAFATRVLDKDFYVEDDHTLDNVWIDETVKATNGIAKEFSFFGYKFNVTNRCDRWKDTCIFVAVQDGREKEIERLSDVEFSIKALIAEDILRIATGRTLSKQVLFNSDEKGKLEEEKCTQEILDGVTSSIGYEISYEEVRETLENGKATDKVLEICKQITEEEEEIFSDRKKRWQ